MPVSLRETDGRAALSILRGRGSLIGSSAQFCAQMLASLIQYKRGKTLLQHRSANLGAVPRLTPAPEPGLLVIARNKCLFVCESIEYQQGIRRPSLRLK